MSKKNGKPPSPNMLPLGDFVRVAEVEGIRITLKAEITAVKYPADDPTARARTAGYLLPLMGEAVETHGRMIQAALSCLAKRDDGFRDLTEYHTKAMALLGDTAARVTTNLMKGLPAFPKIEVRQQQPPHLGILRDGD